MRSALAIATIILVLVIGVAPHTHDARLGTHACVACAVRTCDADAVATVDAAPAASVIVALAAEPARSPVEGAPLGAIPGQSPPAGC